MLYCDISMNFVTFGYVVLFFLLKSRYLEADSSFFDLPSKPDKIWNPSNDFFDDKFKDSTDYDLPSETNDKFQKQAVNMHDKTQAQELIDSIEHIKESSIRKNSNKDLRYRAYFSRLINIFLRKTGLEEGKVDEGSKTVTIDITLSKQNLAILKNFGNDDDISLEALENSFASIFQPVEEYSIIKMIYDSIPLLKKFVLMASLIAIVVYTIYLILKFQFNKKMVIFGTIVVYVSIVSLDLFRQFEDVTEKLILKRMEFRDLSDPPKACFKSKLNIYEKFSYFLMGDDVCQDFLDSRKSVLYNIDVASAFSKPLSSIFLRLCSLIGEGAENLIVPVSAKCPWPLNIILDFMMSFLRLPLLILTFCIIISALNNWRISLKIPCFAFYSEKNENFHDSRKPRNVAFKGREGGGTEISNHSGGIILIANDDTLKEYGMKKENFNFQLSKHLGSTAVESCSLQNNEVGSVKKGTDNIQDRQIDCKCSGFNILKENVKASTDLSQYAFNCHDSNKHNLSIFHSLRNTTSENVFNRQQKLLDEKVKVKKNKSLKRTHYKWKNITEESIKDIFKLHATK